MLSSKLSKINNSHLGALLMQVVRRIGEYDWTSVQSEGTAFAKAGVQTMDIRVDGAKIVLPVSFGLSIKSRLDSLDGLVGSCGVNPLSFLTQDLTGLAGRASMILDPILTTLDIFWGKKIKKHSSSLIDSVARNLIQYLPMVEDGSWIKFVKYQTNYLFSHYFGVEEPEPFQSVYKPGSLLFGPLRRFMIMCCSQKRERKKVQSFLWTVLQGIKKGMPHAQRDLILSSFKSQTERLSRERSTPMEILDMIKMTSLEVFGSCPPMDYRVKAEAPQVSSGATYHRTRREFGTLGDCFYSENEQRLEQPDIVAWGVDMLVGMVFHPIFGVHEERAPAVTWTSGLEEIRRNWINECSFVEVREILEPLKVRTITKAPCEINSAWKEYQVDMWSKLRQHWQFALIGETVECSHLENLFAESQFYEKPDQYWVSGDYSAATDQIHMDCTLEVLRSYCRFSPDVMSLLEKNLCGATVHFPDEYGMPAFRMTNGQLMGSIFSFPILCLINFSVFRYALSKTLGYHVPIDEVFVLINGDDILFRGWTELESNWRQAALACGLEPSLGKNFASKKFSIINSKFFRWTGSQCEVIPYANLGFVFGVKKGANDDLEERFLDLLSLKTDIEPMKPMFSVWGIWESYCTALFRQRREEINQSRLPLQTGPMALGLDLPNWRDSFGIVEFSLQFKRTLGFSLNPEDREYLRNWFLPAQKTFQSDPWLELQESWRVYRRRVGTVNWSKKVWGNVQILSRCLSPFSELGEIIPSEREKLRHLISETRFGYLPADAEKECHRLGVSRKRYWYCYVTDLESRLKTSSSRRIDNRTLVPKGYLSLYHKRQRKVGEWTAPGERVTQRMGLCSKERGTAHPEYSVKGMEEYFSYY